MVKLGPNKQAYKKPETWTAGKSHHIVFWLWKWFQIKAFALGQQLVNICDSCFCHTGSLAVEKQVASFVFQRVWKYVRGLRCINFCWCPLLGNPTAFANERLGRNAHAMSKAAEEQLDAIAKF